MTVLPWPPPDCFFALSAGPGHVVSVPALCPSHRPPQQRATPTHVQLQVAVIRAYRDLPDTMAECGCDEAKFAAAVTLAAPLCCALGSERMDAIARAIPAVWALRN